MSDSPRPTTATPPAAAKPAPAAGILMVVGETVVFPMIFGDDYTGQLGPMPAPGAGQVTDADANVAKSSVSMVGGNATMSIVGLNVGKSVATYRYDEAEVAISVEVVRRVAKTVTFDPNGVARTQA
jgi:hypothetical protein